VDGKFGVTGEQVDSTSLSGRRAKIMTERPFRKLTAYWRIFWEYIARLDVSAEERRRIRNSYQKLIAENNAINSSVPEPRQ